jgi:hypothetical protein
MLARQSDLPFKIFLCVLEENLSQALFLYVCVVLGFELRAYTLSRSTFFVMAFFEIGSHELFCLGWF